MSNELFRINDPVTPVMEAMSKWVANSEGLNREVAAAGAKAFREHFVKRGAVEKNKFGAPSRFWARMRRLTTWRADPRAAVVILPHELRLKFLGGVVRPTGGRKALAIPMSKRAYGKSPRIFKDLIFRPPAERNGMFRGVLMFPGKAIFKQSAVEQIRQVKTKKGFSNRKFRERIRVGTTIGEPAFSLWSFTRHKADKTTLPAKSEIAAAVRAAINRMLRRKGGITA